VRLRWCCGARPLGASAGSGGYLECVPFGALRVGPCSLRGNGRGKTRLVLDRHLTLPHRGTPRAASGSMRPVTAIYRISYVYPRPRVCNTLRVPSDLFDTVSQRIVWCYHGTDTPPSRRATSHRTRPRNRRKRPGARRCHGPSPRREAIRSHSADPHCSRVTRDTDLQRRHPRKTRDVFFSGRLETPEPPYAGRAISGGRRVPCELPKPVTQQSFAPAVSSLGHEPSSHADAACLWRRGR
jgi:hypothetical protein